MMRVEWLMSVLILVSCTPSDSSAVAAGDDRQVEQGSAAEMEPHAVTSRGEVITLEVARSDEQRARGLMFRESLPPAHGMLFVFGESDRHGFWMKNTFIPLDILWLDEEGRIADIITGIPPCRSDPCPTYEPGAPGLWVIELAAGEVARLGLEEGQRIELRNIAGSPNG